MQTQASMLIPTLISAAIEALLNGLIKQNHEHHYHMVRLKGKILQIYFTDLKKPLIFVFSDKVDILTNYEGDCDCILKLKLQDLLLLLKDSNITQMIKQERLILDGEFAVVQSFSLLLKDSKPDIEELIAKITGDVIAHMLVQNSKNIANLGLSQLQKKQQNFAEVIIHEWRIMPAPLEIAYFCDQVTDVQKQCDNIANRLDQLGKLT